jgi:hypothetical protein
MSGTLFYFVPSRDTHRLVDIPYFDLYCVGYFLPLIEKIQMET